MGCGIRVRLVLGVSAFVTQFYELEVYRLEVPVFESGCWCWVAGAVEGGVVA